MNKYRLPVSNQSTTIYGENFLEAIKRNILTVATFNTYDRETRKSDKKVAPHQQVFAQYENGILGGKGGVVVIMRDDSETNTAWLEVSRKEWDEVANGQETIVIQ